jgi:peroxiredoxin
VTLRRSLVLLATSLVVLAISVAAYRADGPSASSAASGTETRGPRPLEVGPSEWLEIPAPDVELMTVSGSPVRLSDYRGQVVLLNFWGTWCPPCRVEIPHLVRTQEKLAELGGTVIAPAVGSGSPEEILAFAAEAGINYPIWIVSDAVAVTRFGAPGYPFTMLIGPDGVVRRTYIGPQTEETLLLDVRLLLAGEEQGRPAGAG